MVEFINADNGENRDFVYQIEWYDRDGMLKIALAGANRVIGNKN